MHGDDRAFSRLSAWSSSRWWRQSGTSWSGCNRIAIPSLRRTPAPRDVPPPERLRLSPILPPQSPWRILPAGWPRPSAKGDSCFARCALPDCRSRLPRWSCARFCLRAGCRASRPMCRSSSARWTAPSMRPRSRAIRSTAPTAIISFARSRRLCISQSRSTQSRFPRRRNLAAPLRPSRMLHGSQPASRPIRRAAHPPSSERLEFFRAAPGLAPAHVFHSV